MSCLFNKDLQWLVIWIWLKNWNREFLKIFFPIHMFIIVRWVQGVPIHEKYHKFLPMSSYWYLFLTMFGTSHVKMSSLQQSHVSDPTQNYGIDLTVKKCLNITNTHSHTHTCMYVKHDNFMQMAVPIGGIPGNSLWYHMHMHVYMCVHVHACAHVCGHPHPIPHPSTPTLQGDPQYQ